jgi:endoglycosylceramidase
MRARLAALLALALAALAPPALAAPALPLGHAGRWITDAEGRVMIVHGVNMVYKLPPYLPSTPGFDEDDAAFLAGEGYNTVRVGVIYKAIEPQPGVYDDAYLDRVAATVAVLARHGIVSLIEFHQDLFNERFQGEGFPDWAVQDDGLPALPTAPFPLNYVVMPAENRAWDHFWANDPGPGGVGLQDRYAAAWRHVAERFRADPSVLGYEVINEPWAGSVYPTCANLSGCPAFDAGPLTAFHRRVRDAIRQVDPRRLVWYEPESLNHFGADSHVGALDAHAGFAFHDYCLPEPVTGNNAGCDPVSTISSSARPRPRRPATATRC